MSSCSNVPEIPTPEELKMATPVLTETEHLRGGGEITDEQFDAIKDSLDRNKNVFSKHKAEIGCCNFVEHETELEV